MTNEARDNSGALFRNTKKELPKHPDYQGQALIGGQEYRMSAWIKEGKNGKFMSLAFSVKDGDGRESRPAAKPQSDEEIPF